MDFEGNCIKCHKFRGVSTRTMSKEPIPPNKRGDKVTVEVWEGDEYVVCVNGKEIGGSRKEDDCWLIAYWLTHALDDLWAEPPEGN
jgi:hypothetical protein